MKTQVKADYYLAEKYLSLGRFISYFYQIKHIQDSGAKRVLLIGVGDGMVTAFLRKSVELVTLDIDAELQPDVVGDITKLPFDDGSFDAVCAFEVLEHMPFEKSEQALAEMARVSRKHVLVSVPHRRIGFEVVIRFPFIQTLLKRKYIRFAMRMPVKFPGIEVSTQHYWEIDGRTTKLGEFRSAVKKLFMIQKEETPVLDMYIRFFDLKKK